METGRVAPMLTAAIFLPLAGAVLLGARRDLEARTARLFAIAVAVVPVALMAVAWARFQPGPDFQLIEAVPWIPTLGVAYRVGVDGLSLPLAALTALLFLGSIAYPVDRKGRAAEYYAVFLFLEFASLGVFLALDLFLFYVFWDLSLVGMYFLIGVWGHGERARRAALKFFLYTLAGSLVMLLAILGLYLSTEPRTFDMAEIIRQRPLAGAGLQASLVFLGFAIGFGIKTPLVPVHTWLPPAHVDAPAPASTILAGVLLKMGTYGFVRISLSMMPESFRRYALPLAILAVISIVYGALVALAQPNLKRRIAYSSVNHMGYAILGIAAAAAVAVGAEAARALALTGAIVEMIAHGFITGALFLITGSIWERANTYELDEFGGLGTRAPALAGAMGLAAFASLGLPGLAGFVAEFQIFVGTFSVYPLLAGIGLIGILITAALFLLMLQRIFFGELPDRWSEWPRLRPSETWPLALLLVFVVAIGVVPAPLLAVIQPTVDAMIQLLAAP